jgi:GNAT superfamily N-acetyltransferase
MIPLVPWSDVAPPTLPVPRPLAITGACDTGYPGMHARMPAVDAVVIRSFEPDDQPEVAALILGGLGEHWGEVDPSLNPDVRDLAGSYPDGQTLVAVCEDRIVGTGTVFPVGDGAAEIKRMSVDPSHRRRGVGQLLVAELVATARSWGLRRLVLETSAHWDDVVDFYLACGFVITHHHDGDYGRDAWFALDL